MKGDAGTRSITWDAGSSVADQRTRGPEETSRPAAQSMVVFHYHCQACGGPCQVELTVRVTGCCGNGQLRAAASGGGGPVAAAAWGGGGGRGGGSGVPLTPGAGFGPAAAASGGGGGGGRGGVGVPARGSVAFELAAAHAAQRAQGAAVAGAGGRGGGGVPLTPGGGTAAASLPRMPLHERR